MKIALIGYGRMGKEIEKIAIARGHEIVTTIDNIDDWLINASLLSGADVAIEFSTPDTAPGNILRCFELNLPVVSGTTGWLDRLEAIKEQCQEKNQALFYAPNFSIGVNIFFEINKRLAQLMKGFPEYDITIEETHHIHKLDAPSGTALRLAKDIEKELSSGAVSSDLAKESGTEVGIKSIREGEVTGIHTVSYDSESDKIEIRHEAKSRRVFASGVIMAAEWLPGKKGFFGMNDLLKINR